MWKLRLEAGGGWSGGEGEVVRGEAERERGRGVDRGVSRSRRLPRARCFAGPADHTSAEQDRGGLCLTPTGLGGFGPTDQCNQRKHGIPCLRCLRCARAPRGAQLLRCDGFGECRASTSERRSALILLRLRYNQAHVDPAHCACKVVALWRGTHTHACAVDHTNVECRPLRVNLQSCLSLTA